MNQRLLDHAAEPRLDGETRLVDSIAEESAYLRLAREFFEERGVLAFEPQPCAVAHEPNSAKAPR